MYVFKHKFEPSRIKMLNAHNKVDAEKRLSDRLLHEGIERIKHPDWGLSPEGVEKYYLWCEI